jgi:hypothetical protein
MLMSEPLLGQILNELKTMNQKMDSLESKVSHLNTKVSVIESTMATKDDVKELPYIRQAIIEINDRTKQIELTQGIHNEAIINHDHQLNIINKRLFTLETDVDRLKSR